MSERDKLIAQAEVGRFAERAYQQGDPLPAVGSVCLVSGVNCDVGSDQHRSYSWRKVLGYSGGDVFVCLQTDDCWPTVERLTNCWFAKIPELRALAAQQPVEEPVASAHCHCCECPSCKSHPQASAPADFRDAYAGAREDLEDWKRRALAAEENNRQLTRALSEEVNGLMFMGEPVIAPAAHNQDLGVHHAAPDAPADHTARGMQGQTGPIATPYVPAEQPKPKTLRVWDEKCGIYVYKDAPAVGVTPDLDALVAEAQAAAAYLDNMDAGDSGELFTNLAQAITDLRAQLAVMRDSWKSECEESARRAANISKAFERITRLEADNAKVRELLNEVHHVIEHQTSMLAIWKKLSAFLAKQGD